MTETANTNQKKTAAPVPMDQKQAGEIALEAAQRAREESAPQLSSTVPLGAVQPIERAMDHIKRLLATAKPRKTKASSDEDAQKANTLIYRVYLEKIDAQRCARDDYTTAAEQAVRQIFTTDRKKTLQEIEGLQQKLATIDLSSVTVNAHEKAVVKRTIDGSVFDAQRLPLPTQEKCWAVRSN